LTLAVKPWGKIKGGYSVTNLASFGTKQGEKSTWSADKTNMSQKDHQLLNKKMMKWDRNKNKYIYISTDKECGTFSAVLMPLVGRQKGRRGVGVVICLERGADCLHTVQLMPLPSQNPIISCFI